MVGTGTSHFLQSNTSTEINSNPKHGMKHMSMNQSVGWVRGEAPVSEFWQFQNRLEPCRGTSPGLWSRAVTLIDKLLRMKPAQSSVPLPRTQQSCCFQRGLRDSRSSSLALKCLSPVCSDWLPCYCFFFYRKHFFFKLLNTLNISLSNTQTKK